MRCVQSYDRGLTEETALRLELNAEEPFMLPCIILLAVGLEYIWENRKLNKRTRPHDMRTEMELAVYIRRKSRSKKILEAAKIMQNTIANFYN